MDISGVDPRIGESRFATMCDGDTRPSVGRRGASLLYGPQKGASKETAARLNLALTRFGEVVREQLGHDILDMPMAGCAGGLAAGAHVFLGAALNLGIDAVLSAINFDLTLEGTDLVITGEGSVDEQTIYEKAPIGVARWARCRGIPVIAVCATVGPGHEMVREHGIDAVISVSDMAPSPRGTNIVVEPMITEAVESVFAGLNDFVAPQSTNSVKTWIARQNLPGSASASGETAPKTPY